MNTIGRGLHTGWIITMIGVLLAASASGGVRYVWPNSPGPELPYDTWATAAHAIQVAIDAAEAGDTVLITNGVYSTGVRAVHGTMTSRVAIDKAIRVESVNGPAVTVIEGAPTPGGGNGDGAIRCVYLGGINAVLSGFTLTNGHTRGYASQYENERSGGGVWCEISGVVTNCIITGSSALSGGGAYGGTLYNSSLAGNLADEGGGAYESTLYNCTLTGNSANDYGGGASLSTLYNCTLTRNSASYGGGSDGGTLYNCTLTGNSAYDGGGASGGALFHCTLSGNSAGGYGGGAYGGTLYHCTLTRNSADSGGGSSDGTLYNCTLTGNSASSYGGIGGGAYGGTLYHCTLSGNSASSGGGASDGTLYNCVAYYNQAPNGPNYFGSAFQYSCTTPLPANGVGNIDTDPQLASASHLSTSSPCIGAGSAAYSSGLDIDGEAWLDPPCMGVDQVVPGNVEGPITVSIQAGYTNVALSFAVSFEAVIEGQLTASTWDFGDGTVLSNQPYASHAWTSPGTYAVRLTGINDTFPQGVSALVHVHVLEQPIYYVDRTNPNPAFPHQTWATAARTIQEAINASTLPGRLVLVTNGVYASGGMAVFATMTNRVVLSDAVLVRSVNGPQVTVIQGTAAPGGGNGDGAIRCVYVGTNAILSGFTLTNGHTRGNAAEYENELSGGGVWSEISGVVTNCVITGNSAYQGGGAYRGTFHNCILSSNSTANDGPGTYFGFGGGAYESTLYNCTLTGNSAANDGGGAYGGTLYHCTLTGNSALYGGGAVEGTLYHCTLSGNSAANDGGGAYGGTLYHCTLSRNSAGSYGGGAVEGTLYNCTMTDNSASYGGGSFGGTLYHCTVTGNSANSQGGGVYYAELFNSIVYFNTAPTNANHVESLFEYSCTTPLPTNGVGNINADPVFLDLAGVDLRLSPGSPCIDTGTNLSAFLTTDLLGSPRPLDGNGDGFAAFDMGAYEFLLPTADSNSDGIPDGWCARYDLNPLDPAVAMGNPDQDGPSTYAEWLADTDPTDPASYFRITAIGSGPTVTVSFPSSSNRLYTLSFATSLTGAVWVDVPGQTARPGLGGIDTLSDTHHALQRFYRVRVTSP